ncbi:hypothetical protein ACJMK2_020040 [Sinanodonta woodiana]|uniref:C-type lectin domain-containing protein n=1 Tax=Sinanodonta woodiana TaxID=1069815 RepID=A0ABD3TXU3_SINWO
MTRLIICNYSLCLLHLYIVAELKPTHGHCSQGWVLHGSSCYHVSHDMEDWADADYMCHKMGGYLAEINTAFEGNFLENQVKLFNFPQGYTWIGATDIPIEGEWIWANSNSQLSSQSYSNWLPGDPNNVGGNQNCLSIGNTGLWADENCASIYHYICEKDEEHGSVMLSVTSKQSVWLLYI